MSLKSGHIPFPSVEGPSEGSTAPEDFTPLPSPGDISKSSSSLPFNQESHVTATSSKLTSSDKLSALPAPRSPTNLNHPYTRPRTAALSTHSFRRSLDASISLPSLMATEQDLHTTDHTRWAPLTSAMRLEGSHLKQGTHENGSAGKETPKQRVSFDSERHSAPAHSISRAFSWMRSSDPTPPVRGTPVEHHERHSPPFDKEHQHSRSASHSRTRGTSPLRFLHQISSSLHHFGTHLEEPFIPINPYQYKSTFPFCCLPHREDDLEQGDGSMSSDAYDCEDILPISRAKSALRDCRAFLMDTLPRELYLNLLLRLPAMYFSRVARIFEDAEVSRPDIRRIIESSRSGANRGSALSAQSNSSQPNPPGPGHTTRAAAAAAANVGAIAATSILNTPLPFPDEWTPGSVPPALIRFKCSWEAFVDSLVKEWKTLNVVSALLASAILTMFQIPEAADDPVTRNCALMSLMCALLSLTYGCMYIVRFGQMRSMFHASRWAEQASKTKTLIWWNVWVLLATPAIWLAWAMLWFISAILSFVWRTGSVADPENRAPLSKSSALVTRVAITSVLALGMAYLFLIIKTLKKYGSHQGSAKGMHRGISTIDGSNSGQMKHGQDLSPGNKGGASIVLMSESERRGRDRERDPSKHSRGGQGKGDGKKTPPSRGRGMSLKGLFRSSVPAREIDVEMEVKVKQEVDVMVNELTR